MLIVLGLAAGGFGAGVFGSLLGLGGGLLIVPLLTFVFGLPFREAVGVSLVCVIVTSSAGAGVYLQRHIANLRLGMLLEVFTAAGALIGGLLAFAISERALAALFTALLVYTAVSMWRKRSPKAARGTASAGAVPTGGADGIVDVEADASGDEAVSLNAGVAGGSAGIGVAGPGGADSAADQSAGRSGRGDDVGTAAGPTAPAAGLAAPADFRARLGGPGYVPRRLGLGVAGGFVAGIVAALLGVGGGIVKVPLMHVGMGVPLKVATATSNLMIGVTAAASAIVYLLRGGIDPLVAGPTAIGVFGGAIVGTRIAGRIHVDMLRLVFVLVLGITAVQMIIKAAG